MTTDLQEEVPIMEKNGSCNVELKNDLAKEKEAVPMMRRFVENVERAFDEWHRWGWPVPPSLPLPKLLWSREGSDWMPQIEVVEQKGNLVVRAELPGMKREEINVEIADGTLVLSGERREKKEERENGYYRSERSYGKFSRAIPLPEGVGGEGAKAEFKDGVLEVSVVLPHREDNRHRIEIG